MAADTASAPPSEVLRLNVPPGADPTTYAYAQAGSIGLSRAHVALMRALYTTDTTLSAREREAMRATIAAVEEGIRVTKSPALEFSTEILPEAFYANLDNYASWSGYSERERLAMEFIRRFDSQHEQLNADEAFWKRLRSHFTDREILDMNVMAGAWIGIHFMNRVLGIVPAPQLQYVGKRAQAAPVVGQGTRQLLEIVMGREPSERQP